MSALASGLLEVGDGQSVYWEAWGDPAGRPALVLHGGPGSGAGTEWLRFFDLERDLVVLMDQRGCGRSLPSAGEAGVDLSVNTTDHLIGDIELLRTRLGIPSWLLVGGSWGTTLALAYAQKYPDAVAGLVLFSVTTTTRAEVEWVTRDMGRVFPREWARFVDVVPHVAEQGDIAGAYAELLADPDEAVRKRAALEWCRWEDSHVSLAPGHRPDSRYDDPAFRATFARLVSHYWSNAAWRGETELLDVVADIAHLPAVLIHGRFDVSSPLVIPWRLHQRWPGSELHVLEAGHGVGFDDAVSSAVSRLRV